MLSDILKYSLSCCSFLPTFLAKLHLHVSHISGLVIYFQVLPIELFCIKCKKHENMTLILSGDNQSFLNSKEFAYSDSLYVDLFQIIGVIVECE